ncbi:hypothetical protein JOC49_000417 [Fusibacter tunisiensis]|uniref:Integrase catalytic domain-containing protein n=1 Tax=Fusibacter tunisiensis TaxID=1008308 RepID=A0ABS2MNC7_9FIRM|nr:hypothetical protein [Fusibacter tunisiensis]
MDVIIAVGYRVNSKRATQFRIWATKVLKEYMIKGFVLDDERLKQGEKVFNKDYFKELLERVRSIDMKPLVLHSDNFSPMKGATLLETLIMLGVMPSNSRPRVSNDNAYAEAIFKTLKYRPGYPRKGLASIEDARTWVLKFARWYNKEHHHSGLNFLTPEQRHSGQGKAVLANRKAVYEAAKLKNPNRWSRNIRNWDLEERVWLNPENEESIEFIEEISS